MHITKKDFKKGTVQLRVTDAEDLWFLSHIIEEGDLVRGKTTRKIKFGGEENGSVSRVTITVMVEAENIEFSSSGTALRINGKIREGPEDIPRGSYHTISLEEGNEFTLTKVQWLEYQKQKLEEAAERKFNYLICIFDREEAFIALTKHHNYEVLVKLAGEVPKKGKNIEVKKDFQEEIIKALEMYNERYKPENIILASPAFYKEDLYKKISSSELKRKIVLATCSDVSESSLNEVIKRPELAQALKNSRAREEQLIVEKLLFEINKNNLAIYGWKEVGKAAEAGAVSELLITTDFIQQQKLKGVYKQLDTLMKLVDDQQGKIHLLSSEWESGKKINGLGGIAALLRYKLEWS